MKGEICKRTGLLAPILLLSTNAAIAPCASRKLLGKEGTVKRLTTAIEMAWLAAG